MKSPIVRLAAIATLVIALTAGCTPDPAPTSSPTGFTSEEQAFAAAEQTYRAYVDALNQVDLSDPQTFEAVYQWTTGDANGGERKSLTEMHANGWTVSGSSVLATFSGSAFSAEGSSVVSARVCMDVSRVRVVNSAGQSQVSSERPDRYALDLNFNTAASAPFGLQIASSNAVEDPTCAS